MSKQKVKSRFAFILSLLMFFTTLFAGVTSAAQTETVKAATNFKDVTSTHWATNAIDRWVDNDIIKGYKDGTFRPNQRITRIDFAVIMNRIFGFQAETKADISDISSSDWYLKDAALAVEAGYLQLDNTNRFQPNTSLTRGEAALALDKLFSFSSNNDSGKTAFKDISQVNPEMLQAITALVAGGYIQGYNGNTFKPEKSMTRAEFLTMLDRIIGLFGKEVGEHLPGTVLKNVVINRAGITLKDVVIEGNLYLTAGIGQGGFLLSRSTVKGKTYINGGVNSIGIQDSVLGDIDVKSKNNKVHVYVTGSTSVARIKLQSGAKIEETNLTGDGFKQVTIPSISNDITLIGSFDEVVTEKGSEMPTITITGTVDNLVINSKAKVILSANAVVKKMTISENATNTIIEGTGKIVSTDNRASGVVFNGKPVTLVTTGSSSGNNAGTNPGTNPGTDPGTDPGTNPGTSLWTKVWGDEFDDGVIDPQKWTYDLTNGVSVGNPGWGNQELQYYTSRPENVKEEDGKLVITARKENYEGSNYTSTRIKTKGLFSKKYGKFEIRASAPTGKGYWPAIWLLPEDNVYGAWAASGEIDIMEGWGSKSKTIAGTLHYGTQYPNNTYTGKAYDFKDNSTIEDFHTYAIEWEPGEIRWYVDGKLYNTQNEWYSRTEGQVANNTYPAPFDEKFHLIMNLAVGGNFDGNPTDETIFPKSLVVDYVRIYELTGRPYRDPVPPTYLKGDYLAGAKLPLSDGNLVYNSNYTQNVAGDAGMGIPNTAHWELFKDTGAEASVAIEEIEGKNYAKVSITNAGSNSYSIQPKAIVSLAKGRYYKLTFNAKTDTTRSMNVRVTGGESRGFEGYSQGLTAALTGEMNNSYEMSFQMKSAPDNAARIEFNMGTNNHPVWIGNVKLVEIENIPFEHDKAKTPQGDGNHIYNGTFDQGETDRMSFWHIINSGAAAASGSVNANERKLNITMTNGGSDASGVKLLQKGVFLLQGHDYKLTFDAKASASRKIEVELARKDGTSYAKKSVNLSATDGTFTVTFDDLAGASDPESQLIFHLGGSAGTVQLDNIKLIRTSNYIPPNIVFYPLVNGDFSDGLNEWETINDSGGYATSTVVEGEAKITIGNQGSNPWSAMLLQNGLPITAGIDYVVSFDARASSNRKMEIIAENAAYFRHLDQTIDLTTVTKHHSFEFTPANDDVANLKFLLGILANTTAVGSTHDVFIDNVVFEMKNAPVAKPPALTKDTTNNKVGQDIDLLFVDNVAWRSKIAAVAIGNVNLIPSDYSVTAGEITINAAKFGTAGSYTIRVESVGYAPISVTQIVQANDGNIVINGSFSSGTNSWNHYVHQDAGSAFTVKEGVAKLAIGYKGTATWHTQFFQEGIKLEAGKNYELSFKAWSTQDRPIIVEFTNTSIPAATFHLTNNATTAHSNIFTANAAGILKLNYLLGDVSDGTWTTPVSEHTISIDDVVIKEVTASSDTVAPSVPIGLTSPSKTSAGVSLSWNASTDNVGVTGYDVYKDMNFVGSTSLTSMVISSLSANTAYSFTVKSKDAAGNVSAASAPLVVTTEAGGGGPLPDQPKLGAGSYTTVLPAEANQVQSMIYKTDNVTGKMQTNDWWSNLAWDQYSEAQYPHPLAMKNQADGMRIYYPGNRITGNSNFISGWMNDIHDFVVGHSNQSTFPDAKVDEFSDWFVSALYKKGDNSMKATYGHGSPFVYFNYTGGNPKISSYDIPVVWSGDANSSVLGITIAGANYALFGPTGSTWSGIGTKVLTNNMGSNHYFSIAVLPDKTESTLNKFKEYAYSHVTDTKVSWSYDESTSEVTTTYTYTTEAKEGTQTGTLFSLYPHQWKNSNTALLRYTYNSVRGLMKTAEGSSFQTTMKFTGVLPSLPDLGTYNKTKLATYVDDAEAEVYDGNLDTYWIGKRLGKLATLAPIADQVGDTVAAEKFRNEIKTRLQDWFTATDGSGKLKTGNLFYYNKNWGTLIGYPDSYGSAKELNDHHFHYGYFIKAAAEIARVDKDWVSDQNWGPMVNLLIRDAANWDRDDEMFPFLRNFDPYAGHSWASGHAKFGDGNNNESSSEALNAWAGIILWGEATGDNTIRDLGIYQYTTEMNAVNNYWFDVNDENHDPNFTRSTASMIWGGKTVGDGVWWTANPEEVHGINWLPITGASLYLTHYSAYTNKNYSKMVEENGGTSFDMWEDLIYMYRAISNVTDAKAKFSARESVMLPEAGNSKANAYHWIYNLDAIGNADPTITADYPIYAVFNKDGVKTYLVYNMTSQEKMVTFSDGHTITVAANRFNMGNGGDPIIPDTEAPTIPAELITTKKTTLTVTLSWNTSTDNEGVTGYDVYVDGVLKGSTSSTAYKVNGLTPNTAYTFTVIARDEAGNQSEASQGLTVVTNPIGDEPEVPDLEGPVTLYLVGDDTTKSFDTKAGTSAAEATIPTAAPGDNYMTPANQITYLMDNVNAVYEGVGVTSYQFYFDTMEATVGTAVLVRISYDFDGDGIWDRMEKSPTYALNPIQNEWERFTNTDRGTVTGSDYQNFNHGKIRVEIWNQFGAGATKVKVNAASDFSRIEFPYSF